MKRCIVVLTIGLVAGLLSVALHPTHAADFTWPHRAARELLAGQNPYHDPTIGTGHPYPSDAPLYYPLPAVLLALPLAPLPAPIAGGVFVGLSSALLAWGLTREGWGNLLLFASAPYVLAVVACQWSILLTAALLVPWLAPVLACKPSLGAAVVAARPTWWCVLWPLLFGLASVRVLPSWPRDWLANLQAQPIHTIPVLLFPPLLLACGAAIYCGSTRSWRGRLLLALCLMPQRLLRYDQLALGLIPETPRGRLVWLISGWISWLLWLLATGGDTQQAPLWCIAGCYLPALVYTSVRRKSE